MKWIRTCQSCGHEQEDKEPKDPSNTTLAFNERKCKKCKSSSFDLGSNVPSTPKEIEEAKRFIEE